jgi:hypothetical protein
MKKWISCLVKSSKAMRPSPSVRGITIIIFQSTGTCVQEDLLNVQVVSDLFRPTCSSFRLAFSFMTEVICSALLRDTELTHFVPRPSACSFVTCTFIFTIANSFTEFFWIKLAMEVTDYFLPHILNVWFEQFSWICLLIWDLNVLKIKD